MFYVVLGYLYGLYGETVSIYQTNTYTGQNFNLASDYASYQDTNTTTSWTSNAEGKSGIIQMSKNVLIGFQEAPLWINLIVLGTFSVFIGYLIVSAFIPTINAGG